MSGPVVCVKRHTGNALFCSQITVGDLAQKLPAAELRQDRARVYFLLLGQGVLKSFGGPGLLAFAAVGHFVRMESAARK